MKIDLVSWESEGLRCPDMRIDLMAGGAPTKVALIQMPNGTGKTTTLKMLTATLTGVATSWKPEMIQAMRRPEDQRDRGRFRVDLRADGKPITFELLLDFEESRVQYRTTTPATGGVTPKWEPPPGVRRFLAPEFIKLFVFDGEFAERLLNQNGNEAERAIDALCQLYLVDEIAELAQQDWETAVRGGGPTTSTGKTMALNRLSKINKQLAKMEKAQTEAHKKLDAATKRLAKVDADIAEHISGKTDLRDQHEQAVAEKVAAQAALDSKLADTMRQVRFPNALHPVFGHALVSLKDNLDRLKLPEATSRQFFVELAEEEFCVCGRPLDTHTREEIVVRSQMYLGQEEAGSINALKKDIKIYCETGGSGSASQLQATTADMLNSMKALHLADQKVRNLKQLLIDSGDAALAALETERAQVATHIDELETLLAEVEREPSGNEDAETTLCLKALLAAKKDAEAKVTKISNTLQLKAQTDIIRDVAQKAKAYARDEIRGALRDECNKLLLTVLGNDPLQIEDIGHSLIIRNQSGASVGQTLSVGYTFLMSLLNRGENAFPLVVDSPCGSLGGGRREAIGCLIPQLCDQFITFVIDKERDDFLPALESACDGSIKYFTAFRITPQTESLQRSLPNIGVTQTASAALIEGRDYFVAFKE